MIGDLAPPVAVRRVMRRIIPRVTAAIGRIVRRIVPPLVLLTVLVAVWEAWVHLADVDPSVIPAPSRVAVALDDQAGTLLGHIPTTMAETGIGLVAGTVIGLAIAVLISGWSLARRAVEPLLVILQTIPPLVLAPLLVLALGFGWAPRIAVVIGVVLFPVAIAAAGAFGSVDPARREMVRAFGATRGQTLRILTLPGSVPSIIDGLRISAAYAVGAAAVAEQIGGAQGGVGLFIIRSQRSFRADQVVAGVVVITVLSLIVYTAVGILGRILTPWHSAQNPERP